MKNLLILSIVLISYLGSKAQTATLDKEKLLEYYQTQRYADAAQYLQTIYPADTKDVKALGQMAYCYMMAGKLIDAERNYSKIDSLQPNTLSVLFSLANINSKRGNRRKTRSYLENIIQLDSTNFNAFKQLSNYTDSAKAKIQYLKKANRLNPIDADVASDLAQAYVDQNLYLPAYQTLKVAIDADTNNYTLQQSQLPIANKLEKYKEVVLVGEKLMADGGAEANVVKDLGKAYFFLKNYQKTIQLFKMLEGMAMQNELTLYYTSLSYRELKNYEMAAIYAKKTIAEGISENVSFYYGLLGGIYETNNQSTNAVAAYKKGLTFNANGSIYYKLALLSDLKLNKKSNALNYYNLYLKSKPDAVKEKEQIEYTKARILELKK